MDAWRLAEPARRQRETTLQQLAGRVAVGESLLLLCHCRGRGKPVHASNRCHGDGIAAELLWRAATQVAGAPGLTSGVAVGTGEPMTSERARAADRGVGERCGVESLDEKSARRDVLIQGPGTAGGGGTGTAFAGTEGQSGKGEATGTASPKGLVEDGAGEKRKGGETCGEAEVVTSRGKRPRVRGGQKCSKRKAGERKQRVGQ